MTTPPPTPPPAPPAPPAPAPSPAPTPPPPAPPGPPAPAQDDYAELRRTLDREREDRKRFEAELAALKQTTMSDAEKAIATARAEGRAEAEKAAALKVVAAEFRARAKDRISNPDAALAVLDLAKLVGADGEPDTKAIDALVAQLAAVPPAPPPPGHIPAGPRQQTAPNGGEDWLRAVRRHR